MLNYIDYLNLPSKIALFIVLLFFVSQLIGEFLELKGKIVPEFFKIRKIFIKRKENKKKIEQALQSFDDFKLLLADFNSHYSVDNITQRNEWIQNINEHKESSEKYIKELGRKIDENSKITLSILIDDKRDKILNFASRITDKNRLVTREQFNRIFKIHKEYEQIIEEQKLTNGEVDIAFKIIEETYEEHMRNHTFLEDTRGYISSKQRRD